MILFTLPFPGHLAPPPFPRTMASFCILERTPGVFPNPLTDGAGQVYLRPRPRRESAKKAKSFIRQWQSENVASRGGIIMRRRKERTLLGNSRQKSPLGVSASRTSEARGIPPGGDYNSLVESYTHTQASRLTSRASSTRLFSPLVSAFNTCTLPLDAWSTTVDVHLAEMYIFFENAYSMKKRLCISREKWGIFD